MNNFKKWETEKNEKIEKLKNDINNKRKELYATKKVNLSQMEIDNNIERLYKDDLKQRKKKVENLKNILTPSFKPNINKKNFKKKNNLNLSIDMSTNNNLNKTTVINNNINIKHNKKNNNNDENNNNINDNDIMQTLKVNFANENKDNNINNEMDNKIEEKTRQILTSMDNEKIKNNFRNRLFKNKKIKNDKNMDNTYS